MKTRNLTAEAIRRLRKERKMTQEELAGALNVSFQAVSKWETGTGLPDITQIPRLAALFGVTTDEILGFSLSDQEARVEEICDEAYKLRFSDPASSRAVLEAGLREFPDNEILLNNILCVVDYKKDPDEMILLASRLADRAKLDDVRYDALRFLSYAYKEKGDLEAAEGALEQIPEIYFTKLGEMAHVLTGEKQYKAARSQKWLSLEDAAEMMEALADVYIRRGDTARARAELSRAAAVLDIMREDEDFYEDLDDLSRRLRKRAEEL